MLGKKTDGIENRVGNTRAGPGMLGWAEVQPCWQGVLPRAKIITARLLRHVQITNEIALSRAGRRHSTFPV